MRMFKKGDWTRRDTGIGCAYYYHVTEGTFHSVGSFKFYTVAGRAYTPPPNERLIELCDYFIDYKEPTKEELALWHLEFVVPYWTECNEDEVIVCE